MSDHLERLNLAQQAAAIVPAPVLVLAGAGSGKTETLIRRVADLILKGEAPGRLLCITFTAKAAGEMRARLAGLLGADRAPGWVGTFHGVMARLLLEDARSVPGLPQGFTILGQAEARKLLMQAAGVGDIKEAVLLQEAVSLLKNGLTDKPARLPRSSALARIDADVLTRAAAVLPAYDALLAQRQAVDLDDLIAVPVRAMRVDAALAARWAGRWAEILIDEYQDTNHAQHALVKLLAGQVGRVFAVGDDLQAIYGWRGADVAYIRRFGRDYPAASRTLRLETNYRSTPTILRAANAVAAEDRDALPKTLRPADPQAPPGAPIVIREALTAEEEGRGAVGWVQALRRAQPDLPWRECAVLVRAGFVAKPILEALQAAGIPTRQVAERETEMPKPILAAIAWLRLAMSRESGGTDEPERWAPGADDAFRRACAVPPRGIGSLLFGRLRAHAAETGVALAAAVGSLPGSAGARSELEAVIDIARGIGDGVSRRRLGPARALRLAAEASGILDGLQEGSDTASGLAWAAALELADQAGSVSAFCEAAALGDSPGEADGPDGVQVMTLHKAKGLEFDHVFLAGLEEGVWPHWQAEQHGALAEERRLFYVGLTRARHTLRLSWVRSRRDWDARPSRFLASIPEDLVEGSVTRRRDPQERAPAQRAKAAVVAPATQAETDRLVVDFLARRAARKSR